MKNCYKFPTNMLTPANETFEFFSLYNLSSSSLKKHPFHALLRVMSPRFYLKVDN